MTDPENLTTADWGNFGSTAGANDIDLSSSMISGQYNAFTLNSTGLSWIDPTGITSLGIRLGHDLDNQVIIGDNYAYMNMSEETGISNDPYLEVMYTVSTSTDPYSADVLQDLAYTYDAVGDITQIVDISETLSEKTLAFVYDDLYRLTAASSTNATSTSPGDYSRTYTYNALGNITDKSDQGTYLYQGDQGTSTANPHAATSINGVALSYDTNGNLVSDSTWGYTWDYRNRLTTATTTGTTVSHTYDHTLNRVTTFDGSSTSTYVNRLYNTDGTTTTKHIYAADQLIATITYDGSSTSTQYLHTDHLGGSSVVTNSSGAIVQVLDYYPFGDLRINTQYGSFDEQRKFTGHEYDGDTDLTYANARYYPAKTGRWLSQDPIAMAAPKELLTDPQQLNTYSYVRNNPLVGVDPDGLLTVIIPGTGYDANAWNTIDGSAKDFTSSVQSTFNETHHTEVINDKNIWSGGNNTEARQQAADFISGFISSYNFAEGEELNIVGHSHGGNVGILVSQQTDRKIDNLVTLGTPVRSDYQPNYENIGNHVNGYSWWDGFQTKGGNQYTLPAIFGKYQGEFGPADQKYDSANNMNVSFRSGFPYFAHSNLWQNSSVWAKVDKELSE